MRWNHWPLTGLPQWGQSSMLGVDVIQESALGFSLRFQPPALAWSALSTLSPCQPASLFLLWSVTFVLLISCTISPLQPVAPRQNILYGLL